MNRYSNFRIFLFFLLLIVFSSCGDKKGKKQQVSIPENAPEENDVKKEKSAEALYLFKDFYPGSKSDFVQNVFASNGNRFFFTTYKNSERQAELWVCDGTEAGAQKITSFGWISSEPLDGYDSDYAYTTNYGAAITSDHFYFLAGKDRNEKNLYVTNGKPGDQKLLMPDLKGTTILFSYQNKVYFNAQDEQSHKKELFEANSREVKQITKDGSGQTVLKIVEGNGNIYFAKHDRRGVYQWDGESLSTVLPQLKQDRIQLFENGLEVSGDYIYFYAIDEGNDNKPGFYAGNLKTGKYKNLVSHESGVNYDTDRPHIYAFNNKVYFAAPASNATKNDFTGKNIKEIFIWEANGFSAPKPIKSLKGDKEYSPYVAMEFSDHISNKLLIDKYSNPNASGSNDGDMLYSLDAKSGELAILDTLRQDFEHYYKSKTSDYIYFKGWKVSDYDKPQQLWRTDGTPEGTIHLESSSDYKFANKSGIAVLGSKVFFVANGDYGTDLWVFDESIFTVKVNQ